MFSVYTNENAKLGFSNFPGLNSVFEKLRFRDRFVWTVGLTAEIKLSAFSNCSGVAWMGPYNGVIFCSSLFFVISLLQERRCNLWNLFRGCQGKSKSQ